MLDPNEGVLDPWVAQWITANGAMMEQPAEYTPEYLAMARTPSCPFPTREVAKATDCEVEGVPVRIYEHEMDPDGVIVYFHGGGFCTGSIGLMENIATELATCANVAVVSVGYRLAPEHPYPAALDDCETVTRWVMATAGKLRTTGDRVVVGGESAGGNLAAALSLRLMNDHGPRPAGQLLIYPGLAPAGADYPSRTEHSGPMLDAKFLGRVWDMYSGGKNLENDPLAAPLEATDLSGVPPALVILGGCDPLRDEGREYARRLRGNGVPTEEACFSGQPHGFLNLGFPASQQAYERIGLWLKALLGR